MGATSVNQGAGPPFVQPHCCGTSQGIFPLGHLDGLWLLEPVDTGSRVRL